MPCLFHTLETEEEFLLSAFFLQSELIALTLQAACEASLLLILTFPFF